MKPVIAIPYFPGSNGLYDAEQRVKEFGMKPLPLYFHIGDEKRLEENHQTLLQADGVVLPGGFPYEDRLGFGRVPAKIPQFAQGMREVVDSGKPVIAFCSGNQIAHAIGLAFPEGSAYRTSMKPNISHRARELVHRGFYDAKTELTLVAPPQRNAFTRSYRSQESFKAVIDHGGGRLDMDEATLQYLIDHDLIITQYTVDGVVFGEFPNNPNGSVMNIESIGNARGNLKIGMAHHERKLNALATDRSNMVFASMREYIEDGNPDLSEHARSDNPMRPVMPHFGWLDRPLDEKKTIDIYIRMLTDDNERNTAQLFLDNAFPLERRRHLRLELKDQPTEQLNTRVVEEIAAMDFYDGIMLKKDVPTVSVPDGFATYTVVGKDGKSIQREFHKHDEIVEGFPQMRTFIDGVNPQGYALLRQLQANQALRHDVVNAQVGESWFFRTKDEKLVALEKLLE